MPKTNTYDRQHRANVAYYQRLIDAIFEAATKEAAAIGSRVDFDPSRVFSFDDYPITQDLVKKLLSRLGSGLEAAIVDGVRSEWTLANNKNDELARVVFGDNVGRLTQEQYRRYFSNNHDARQAFLNRKEQGLNLSERVWRYADQFKSDIELGLDIGIRSGLDAPAMSRELQQFLQHPDMLFRRVRDEHGILQLSKRASEFHPGQGVYRSSYKNARRLAATETNMAYHSADHERWQQLDFVVGIEIRLSGNHTCMGRDGKPHEFHDICDELQGRYPKDFKFTGWHPHCRCQAISILKTEKELMEENRAILRGEEPSTESVNTVRDVPDNFKQWVADNEERIARAKTMPYFLRDNEQYWKGGGAAEHEKDIHDLIDTSTAQIPQRRTTAEPPRMDTYSKDGDFVMVSSLHKESEREENIRMATFLGTETQETVFILPHIQPTRKDADALRSEYFPQGVKEGKNPDFYFRGRFLDGKSMMAVKIDLDNTKAVKRKIQNRLDEAFEQADDAFLEIPTTIPIELVRNAVKGKLASSKHMHYVYVRYGDSMIVFGG